MPVWRLAHVLPPCLPTAGQAAVLRVEPPSWRCYLQAQWHGGERTDALCGAHCRAVPARRGLIDIVTGARGGALPASLCAILERVQEHLAWLVAGSACFREQGACRFARAFQQRARNGTPPGALMVCACRMAGATSGAGVCRVCKAARVPVSI